MGRRVLFCRFHKKHSPCDLREGLRRLHSAFGSDAFAQSYLRLLEELVVSHVFADLDIAAFFAEIQNFSQQRIIAGCELFLVADSSGLNSYLNNSIVAKQLVETQFFSSIFLKDIPVLNNIYHLITPKTILRRKDKGILAPAKNSIF
jgi:hypothetical protein